MIRNPALSSRTRWSGRHGAALLLLALAGAVAGLLAVSKVQANPSQMIGLDMTPATGSSPAGTTVDACVEVDVGDTFEADVFATNVQNLTNFDLRVDFDPSILSLDNEAIDYSFLLTKDGGGALFPLADQEKPGRWFIAAAESKKPDSGSGTLVRLTFEALKKGTSTVSVAGSPVGLRPLLKGLQGFTAVNIGDDNGDGFWDGGLSSGKVAIGQSCTGSTPVVTPSPTNVPNTTPGPGAGNATSTPASGQGSGSGGGTDSGGSGDDPDENGPDFVGNIDPDGGDPDATSRPGSAQDPEDASDADGGGIGRAGDSGSSGPSTLVLAGIAAALAIAAGAALLWLRMVSGRE